MEDNKIEHFLRHAMLGRSQMQKGNTREAKSEFKRGEELGFDPGSPFPKQKGQFWKK